ncbi:hypothetical protein PVE41_01875 [Vibrio vulnificus]|uniref:hypothetical protein n=1 Tax=Vibrio vulnificus TaxID=672 RepID=UPI001A21A3F4|nr:hypothetical protein [Vibrio vulnificus]WHE21927.1 hypothetical protein PVE41_01875 [Vibrio vulnificus]HAS6208443.1 hypothetical protein [Vibrio vulnificus]HAT8497693.1 hypothetical protein [Vibrio vulnificus]
MFKSVFQVVLLLVVPVLANANSFEEIPDFSVSCKALKFGSKEVARSSNLVWSRDQQKLSITGDGIKNDSGELTTYNVSGSERSLATSVEAGLSQYSKHINMTFREKTFSSSNEQEYIRTFRFNIPKGSAQGSISNSDISNIGGVMSVNMTFFATGCSYSSI